MYTDMYRSVCVFVCGVAELNLVDEVAQFVAEDMRAFQEVCVCLCVVGVCARGCMRVCARACALCVRTSMCTCVRACVCVCVFARMRVCLRAWVGG